ncbi:poly synthase subunit PhaE protein [Halorhabdus tiamatea SARL4B]|uniref:Poly(3-hydroxyalkanoate) polymerase subunit PhaE n=1 Tax=Halorhabdus tiamatea SARL4B TaxID=1033806 RepID=F7PFZ9_9EURY|nr:poly(R)-hydroxyalkanoic acid synthase subunit PhaE [Halorhabdus tiamatea]ERJ07279.1 poly synthase subunit PhaE protein [Halorhabdus tiamatea SARL4B]CCQ34188.1 poly(R)-hydroxyalkanoic acid synthase, subunit PhaE [Halorhabdus tiamatea SARL4B]
MSDKNADVGAEYSAMLEDMNEAVAESIEQNVQAQAAFVESWSEALSESVMEDDELAEGVDGYNQATEVWMDAAERMFERSADAAQGEEVDPTEFRDIWLQSANEAAKEIMGTSAFAAANGQLIQSMLDMQQQADDVSQETIAELGFPTRDDIDEVGERLIELERRQHALEEKLDRILEAVEE